MALLDPWGLAALAFLGLLAGFLLTEASTSLLCSRAAHSLSSAFLALRSAMSLDISDIWTFIMETVFIRLMLKVTEAHMNRKTTTPKMAFFGLGPHTVFQEHVVSDPWLSFESWECEWLRSRPGATWMTSSSPVVGTWPDPWLFSNGAACSSAWRSAASPNLAGEVGAVDGVLTLRHDVWPSPSSGFSWMEAAKAGNVSQMIHHFIST